MKDKLRAHIEKLMPLTEEEFEFVIGHFTTQTVKKHQFLIREGQSVKTSYFVLSGLLKLVHTDDSGSQHIISFAMEDWWESDFQAFYTQSPATLSLQCIDETEVCCLSLDNYQHLCDGLQKMERFFLEKSTFGFIAAQQRILSLMTTDAKTRYERLVRQHPALCQRLSKTLLASYLGVSRETLSRLSR